jgi:hypothetical protein
LGTLNAVNADDAAEYHTPLCVVRKAETIAAADEMEIALKNKFFVDVSYMEPNSKFGISPFTINLTHKDAPLECQFKLEKELKAQNERDKKRYENLK